MIDLILSDHQHFHSTWQIDTAITIRSGGTLYGCYKQAVRELHKRWRGLRELYQARSLAVLDIDEQEERQNLSFRDCKRRDLRVRELRLGLIETEQVIADTEREFLRFYGQAIACRRALGLSDDEPMPDDLRERLDAEMWEHHLKAMAAVDYITTGRLGRSTVELLAACHPDTRQRLAADILDESRHGALVRWYLTQDCPMPEPARLTEQQERSALGCVLKPLSALPATGTPAALLCSQGENIAGG